MKAVQPLTHGGWVARQSLLVQVTAVSLAFPYLFVGAGVLCLACGLPLLELLAGLRHALREHVCLDLFWSLAGCLGELRDLSFAGVGWVERSTLLIAPFNAGVVLLRRDLIFGCAVAVLRRILLSVLAVDARHCLQPLGLRPARLCLQDAAIAGVTHHIRPLFVCFGSCLRGQAVASGPVGEVLQRDGLPSLRLGGGSTTQTFLLCSCLNCFSPREVTVQLPAGVVVLPRLGAAQQCCAHGTLCFRLWGVVRVGQLRRHATVNAAFEASDPGSLIGSHARFGQLLDPFGVSVTG